VCLFVCLAATVINKTSTDGDRVLGVTSVDDELFVLLRRNVDQVAVYSVSDYRLQRRLSVLGLRPCGLDNMTSCVHHKCLYMSDFNNSCIHRYDLRSSAVIKWPVCGSPIGLSVTPSGNLLVACRGKPSKLVELSADSGQRVREITLQSDIRNLRHSVKLTTDPTHQYVVCHGEWIDSLHRVCLVGGDGNVTRSYGGQRGSDVGQLRSPRHLAVDKDSQSIFVADCQNDRVVLLSPTLEFVCYVTEELSDPYRLYLDQVDQPTRRLFVGQYDGDVVVIQL